MHGESSQREIPSRGPCLDTQLDASVVADTMEYASGLELLETESEVEEQHNRPTPLSLVAEHVEASCSQDTLAAPRQQDWQQTQAYVFRCFQMFSDHGQDPKTSENIRLHCPL